MKIDHSILKTIQGIKRLKKTVLCLNKRKITEYVNNALNNMRP